MKTVNIQEAKTHLSRLIEQVTEGSSVVIARAGKPVALLTPWKPETASRSGGGWSGQAWIAGDFDEHSPEIEGAFAGAHEADPVARVAEKPRTRKAR